MELSLLDATCHDPSLAPREHGTDGGSRQNKRHKAESVHVSEVGEAERKNDSSGTERNRTNLSSVLEIPVHGRIDSI